MAGEETAPPPGTARGLRVNTHEAGAQADNHEAFVSTLSFFFLKIKYFESTIFLTIRSW